MLKELRNCLPLLVGAALIGCGNLGGVSGSEFTQSPASENSPVNPAPLQLIVANLSSNIISIFDATQTGDVSPLRKFGFQTGLATPFGVAVDTQHNELFAANIVNNSVTV